MSGEKKDIYSNNNNIISEKSDFFFKLSLSLEAIIETIMMNFLNIFIFSVDSFPQKPKKLKQLFSVVPGGACIAPRKSDPYLRVIGCSDGVQRLSRRSQKD